MPAMMESPPETAEESAGFSIHEGRIEEAAERVRVSYKCVRLHISSIPRRRGVKGERKQEAAELYDAEADALTVLSRIWNANEPVIKQFNAAHAAVREVFFDRRYTLPTAEAGLRMLKRGMLSEFDEKIRQAAVGYAEAADELHANLPMLRENARESRGSTFNAMDYAFDPREICQVDVSYPTITEDQEIATLDPAIYRREMARVREDFKQMIACCEREMQTSLCEAVSQLATGLEVGPDGKKKVFRDSTVARVLSELEYISEQWNDNRIGGEGLQEAATRLRRIFDGQDAQLLPETLRQAEVYRQQVKEACEQVVTRLNETSMVRPRRALLVDWNPNE